MSELKTFTEGTAIYDDATKKYYCGLNTWDRNPSKAKIYTSKAWLNEALKKYKDYPDIKTCHVTTQVTLTSEEDTQS